MLNFLIKNMTQFWNIATSTLYFSFRQTYLQNSTVLELNLIILLAQFNKSINLN